MIANKQQYQVTRDKAKRFSRAIREMKAQSNPPPRVHPRIARAQKEAMERHLQDLKQELSEYEESKNPGPSDVEGQSLEELPEVLIKARKAAGLTQRALAKRLGLQVQQIQRYEAERYSSANPRRLHEVADALGVRIRNKTLIPGADERIERLLAKVGEVGLSREFVLEHLVPSAHAGRLGVEPIDKDASRDVTDEAAAAVERVYGWTHSDLFGPQPLSTSGVGKTVARFRRFGHRDSNVANLFEVYANYLAKVAIGSMVDEPRKPIPVDDPQELRQHIMTQYRADDFKSTLHAVWDLGVVVMPVPLQSSWTFHGACWRHAGRNAIVLSEESPHEARWTFDLLRELYHAGQRPNDETFEFIEQATSSGEERTTHEETTATRFAANVMLDGKAEDLAEECLRAVDWKVQRLKSEVPRVASSHGVGPGALAYYLAYRLSKQGVDWREAAARLQRRATDPRAIAAQVFRERIPERNIVDEFDRKLISLALA